MIKTAWIAAAAAVSMFAQQPRIENARIETRAVSGGLDAAFRAIVAEQTGPSWVGYSEPMISGRERMCCWNGDSGGCLLEPGQRSDAARSSGNETVKLEGPTNVVVLYRIENRAIQKIRSFTPECTLDAGGLPFLWLNGVAPGDSIAYLLNMARAEAPGNVSEQRHRGRSAVSAIAFHADPAAKRALEQLAEANQPVAVREQAVFWLAAARGKAGFDIVSRVVREEPNEKIRERAIFALTQSKEPGALDAVVRAAHDDKSARVRGQALFWLAQKAAQKTAQAAITDAIANDPETQVKRRAVFALTQIPNGEGVPLLIEVARANQNPAVRKQAMFWLGQSKDPRALAYIEQILK